MIRIKLNPQNTFFKNVLYASTSLRKAAFLCGIHERTMRDWVRGKYNPPRKAIELLSTTYTLPFPPIIQEYDEAERRKIASHLGGIAKMKKYGPPGTPEGRRKGGIISQKKMTALGNEKFIVRKKIVIPKLSVELAELVGILLGDGHIDRFQIEISLDLKGDVDYAHYINTLLLKLFETRVRIKERPERGTISLFIDRINIIDFLQKIGLQKGNKIKNHATIPHWILKNPKYMNACIRGLVDTDGCFFVDRHSTPRAIYLTMGIAFTSAIPSLMNQVFTYLQKNGFCPTLSSAGRIMMLRRHKQIVRYFNEIGASNPKHLNKYLTFIRRSIEVVVTSRTRNAV